VADHDWTEDDDLIAFYLSRHNDRFLGVGTAAIARALSGRVLPDGRYNADMTEGALLMRKSNFDYLDGRLGLSNYAAQSQRIHEQYKDASVIELRPMVMRVLGLPMNDRVERRFREFCDRFSPRG
jgi:hypothetical protein